MARYPNSAIKLLYNAAVSVCHCISAVLCFRNIQNFCDQCTNQKLVLIIAICGCYLFSQDQLPLGWWTASNWLPRAQRCPPLCYFCVNDRCVCNINWRPGSRRKRGETQSFSESFLPGCALLCCTSSSHGKCK